MSSPNLFSTKSDAAYAEIRRRILAGELAPGSVLDQYLLSDSMGMSITPLREALRRLRGEGLIDIDVHKNTRVTPLSATEARELFDPRTVRLGPQAGVFGDEPGGGGPGRFQTLLLALQFVLLTGQQEFQAQVGRHGAQRALAFVGRTDQRQGA